MKSFSIKQLESLSGVKAHTLRVWEKRYRMLVPERTNGNIRYYSFEQVTQLLNTAMLVKWGCRISSLSKLNAAELSLKTGTLKTGAQRIDKAINDLICLMFLADIEEFETVLENCILSWQIDKTICEVIIPFLQRTNVLSYNDSSSEVHFVVTAVRNKIISGIEKLNLPFGAKNTVLLFLPENEHYDLVLLYMHYLLKSGGFKVLYLGTNISAENLKLVLQSKSPNYLFTHVPEKTKCNFAALLHALSQHWQSTPLFVAHGSGAANLVNPPEGVHFIHYQDAATSLRQHIIKKYAQ